MISEVFLAFFKLGLTSFGGPIAHLGYFREEFVEKRKWLDASAYADLVALCQFLPGPSSSQVGMAIGLIRAGVSGSLAAWVGFTLPSALVLMAFGVGIAQIDLGYYSGLLHGLKLVAAAVIAQAIWTMAKSHFSELIRVLIGLAAAAATLMFQSSYCQVGVIAVSGFFGILLFNVNTVFNQSQIHIPMTRKAGLILLIIFAGLLAGLPLAASQIGSYALELFAKLFQTGSLVFGGGHVVLALLQSQVVPSGWISNDTFLAGYGLTQAVPGPLFTFAAYIGAVSNQAPSGWIGGILALAGIFAPSFFMVLGILPFWNEFRRNTIMQKSLIGINAAVVGLLLAAFYSPVWISTVSKAQDLILIVFFYILLQIWKRPPWMVVVAGAFVGAVLPT